ncbi:MAG: S8 family serine peptidase [Henriciella sp.]|nr:S8 family serine peptidase [Henriciella sp.]
MKTRYQAFQLTVCGLLALTLTACDRQQERADRANGLISSVINQILGNEVDSAPDQLEAVPVEARAMSGTIQPQSVQVPPQERAASRFVIGSIVAKPRDLPPPVAMASVKADPTLAEDIIVDDMTEAKIVVLDEETTEEAMSNPEVIEKIQGPTTKRTRSIAVMSPRVAIRERTRSLSPRDPDAEQAPSAPERSVMRSRSLPRPPSIEEKIAALPDMRPKLAERALTMRAAALDRQMIAEDRMIEAANKFGVAAAIQRSRTGQMVIEIGADAMSPTQFQGQTTPQQTYAYETDIECTPENVEAARNDPLLAMQCVIDDLQASGEFEYVEKDYVFDAQIIRRPEGEGPTTVQITPNDPLFDLQWHLRSQGSDTGESAGGAGFVDFWTNEGTQGSPDVVVAVIDTGLDMAHPDISESENLVRGWDMVTDPLVGNDGDGRDDNPDDPGDACPENGVFADTYHGTHVAGTVGAGATNNRAGIAGAAWNVKIVPVRALGKCGGRLSDINDAIRWAAGEIPEFNELNEEVWNDNPADIINLSIGLFRTCPASLQDAIDAVTAQGVVVVAAAGNDRVSTEFYAPAGCRNVVTVAGSDARGFLAPYSNFGDEVDILAPGGDLTRDDNGDGNPDGVLSTKSAANCFDPVSGQPVASCFYAYEQGTSMAAPHVSGALALIKSKRPELTATELVSRLMTGVTSITGDQCLGECRQFPGATRIEGNDDICLRKCGSGLLDMGAVDLSQ